MRPYQVQSHQPVQFQAPPPIQLPQMPMVQALRTQDQPQQQGGMPKGLNTAIRKGIEKLTADGSLSQAEATKILTSDAAYTGGGIPGMTPAEATRVLTSDAAYGGGMGAAGTAAGGGITTLGGANTIAGLGGGISGASVTGGSVGAGLGGAGTASGASSGLAAAGPAAAVLALPFVANALDEGNKENFIEAQNRIDSGDFLDVGNGLKLVQGKGGTYLSGPKMMLDRARTAAEKRGIKTFNVGNNLASFQSSPDITRSALSGLGSIEPDPTVFSDYRNPRRRSFGSSNPMTTALRGR